MSGSRGRRTVSQQGASESLAYGQTSTSSTRSSRRAATQPYPTSATASSSSSAGSSPPVSRGTGRGRSQASDAPERRIELSVIQQPERGLAAGIALRLLGRVPIQPPPVLQVIVTEDGHTVDIDSIANSNILICSASLIAANESEEALDYLPQSQRTALVGLLVSDLKQVQDQEGDSADYFVFGDLSARAAGRYRLKFVLAAAQPGGMTLAEVISDEFEVFEPGDFSQLPSTDLTRHLVSEGVLPATLL